MSTRRRLASVPDTPRRWIAYVRVSDVRGRAGETFHSPDMQIDAIRTLMARTAGVEVEVVQDIDRTGRTFAREGIDRIMQLARAGEVDVVGVYDLSRFGRNTGESLRYIRELRDLGVHVVSTVEQIDDSPEGQFMLGQFLGMAQLYSDQIGRRWKQVIARRAEQGRWHGGVTPFGYVRHEGDLVPDPLLAEPMVEAFTRYARGELITHIARDFTRVRGRMTEAKTLKRAFRNPVYIGQVRHGEQTFPGRHEALVDDVTWQRVQRRLAVDSRTPSRTLAVSHSLVGLVVCDECGTNLRLHQSQRCTPDGAPYRHLQCRRRIEGGPEACPGIGTPSQRVVEAAVLEQLAPLLEQLKVDPASKARRARAGVDVGRLRRELTKTETAIGRLAADLARREISPTAYRLAAAELEGAAEALRVQIDDQERVAEAPTPSGQVRQAKALLAAWADLTVAEQNRSLRALLRQVRIRRAAYPREPVGDRVEVIPIS